MEVFIDCLGHVSGQYGLQLTLFRLRHRPDGAEGLQKCLLPRLSQTGDAVQLAAIGAAAVLLSGEKTPEELVRMVATPGGTTQAALDAMTDKGFDEALIAGLEACARRSAELGR